MKKRHYILVAVTSYIGILIATLPAQSISKLINENTELSLLGVKGTLWSGSASTISINDIQLQNTAWEMSAWKLFIGLVSVDINTHYLGNDVTAEAGSSFLGRLFINNLVTKLPASNIAQLANIPLVQLSGDISIDIEHAEWKQGTLPIATGTIGWSAASITVAETVSLGTVSISLFESEEELLKADIKNKNGDIKVSGNAELVLENNYAVNIKLSPTATASDNIKQSLGLFAKRQANGEFLFIQNGSLNQIGLI